MEHSVAAAQIRHDRGVTPQNKAYFHEVTFPTDPAVIDALVRGTSDLLTLLDEIGGETWTRPPDGTGTETQRRHRTNRDSETAERRAVALGTRAPPDFTPTVCKGRNGSYPAMRTRRPGDRCFQSHVA